MSIVTNLPVSATKSRWGPGHTICHLIPALVGNSILCHCCRCRAPLREQVNENQTKLPGLEGCSNSGSTYKSCRYLATLSTISLLHSSTAVSVRLPPPFPCRHSWRPLLRGVASCSPPRPCASHLVIKHSAASTTTRYRLPPFLAAVGHDSVSTPNAKGTVFVHASVARNTP